MRAFLLPLISGHDFHVWDLSALATIGGQNIFETPPLSISKTGPYAYFPLYLYILLPFRFLALHTSLPYTVLGKIPVVLGDIAVSVQLAAIIRDTTSSERKAAVGAACFFLNPLVLYNGAFYGRFDSLCLAAVLAAWQSFWRYGTGSLRGAIWIGIAVALKTFPLFLVPYAMARAGGRRGLILGLLACAIPLLTALPYLVTSARQFFAILFIYNASKAPSQFSWQVVFLRLGMSERLATELSFAFFALFAGLLFFLIRRVPDPYAYGALVLVLFLLFNKVVLEQYFLWPLPFLIVLVVRDRNRAAAFLAIVLSIVGISANQWLHPFGYLPSPPLWMNVALALVMTWFVVLCLRPSKVMHIAHF